jgi:hypothetical protein
MYFLDRLFIGKRYIYRLALAIMYHNENTNRPFETYKTGSKKGQIRYRITRSKMNKQQPIAKKIQVPPTYGK